MLTLLERFFNSKSTLSVYFLVSVPPKASRLHPPCPSFSQADEIAILNKELQAKNSDEFLFQTPQYLFKHFFDFFEFFLRLFNILSIPIPQGSSSRRHWVKDFLKPISSASPEPAWVSGFQQDVFI
jgi:hypothetical protein